MSRAYCVKCRTEVDCKNEEEHISKNKRRILLAICAKCGTKVCKFLPMSGQGVIDE